jgi:hypothetical protein
LRVSVGPTPTRESLCMAAEALHREIKRLIDVCEQLDVLAGEHPSLEKALSGIAGSIRNSAVLLELLVAIKLSN